MSAKFLSLVSIESNQVLPKVETLRLVSRFLKYINQRFPKSIPKIYQHEEGKKMIDPEGITHKTALNVFRLAFARRVGVGETKASYGDLQDNTGIPIRTLKSWHDGQAMPHIDNLLKLCVVFGPDFTTEILVVAGQGGVENLEIDEQVNAMGTAADLVKMTNEITERLRDGVFCHRDRAVTGPKLLELSRALEAQGKAMLEGLSH